jgi:tetratricopeptide (TPR) repeat protein
LSRELLGDAAPYSAADLAEHFRDGDKTPEQRVVARIDDARKLVEEKPRRAWQRAVQAVRLLGDPDRPNGVADPVIRRDAHQTLLTTAARLLLQDGLPEGLTEEELLETAGDILPAMASDRVNAAFDALEDFVLDKEYHPYQLLEAAVALGDQGAWLREAFGPIHQMLRREIEQGPTAHGTAGEYRGQVAGWLELTGYLGDAAARAAELRRQAVDTLIAAEKLEAAEAVLQRIEPPDLVRLGRLREAQQAYTEAAEIFERAGRPADALRNWRHAGRWERALPLAAGDEGLHADLQWLGQVAAVLERQPDGQRERMSKQERRRLQNLFARAAGEPERRR